MRLLETKHNKEVMKFLESNNKSFTPSLSQINQSLLGKKSYGRYMGNTLIGLILVLPSAMEEMNLPWANLNSILKISVKNSIEEPEKIMNELLNKVRKESISELATLVLSNNLSYIDYFTRNNFQEKNDITIGNQSVKLLRG